MSGITNREGTETNVAVIISSSDVAPFSNSLKCKPQAVQLFRRNSSCLNGNPSAIRSDCRKTQTKWQKQYKTRQLQSNKANGNSFYIYIFSNAWTYLYARFLFVSTYHKIDSNTALHRGSQILYQLTDIIRKLPVTSQKGYDEFPEIVIFGCATMASSLWHLVLIRMVPNTVTAPSFQISLRVFVHQVHPHVYRSSEPCLADWLEHWFPV